jgi:SPP1 family predicted phage head-tail adaptor
MIGNIAIGRFDRKIILLRRTEQATEFNTGKFIFTSFATPWGNIDFNLGNEQTRADQETENRSVVIRIRYRTDLDTTMRAVINNQIYGITSITEPNGHRKQVIEINASLILEEVYEVTE